MPPKRTEAGEQLELGAARRDAWADKLGLELAIMLTPHVNDSLSQEECRALAVRFAELAARRAREAGALKPLRVWRCRGCDAEVEVESKTLDVDRPAVLCATCAGSVRSAGSDG